MQQQQQGTSSSSSSSSSSSNTASSTSIRGLDDASHDGETDDVSLYSTIDNTDKKFTVTREVAVQAQMLKGALDQDTTTTALGLDVPSAILERILVFMVYHSTHPLAEIKKPITSTKMLDIVVDPWYANFADTLASDALFALLEASNYMGITGLVELACAKAASLVKGRTPAEIRETFHIEGELTKEEQEALLTENKWADDAHP